MSLRNGAIAEFESKINKNKTCDQLKTDWLDCIVKFRVSKHSFLASRVCEEKYINYTCKCLDEDAQRRRRIHCSILATH